MTLTQGVESCSKQPGADATLRPYAILDEDEAAVLDAVGAAIIPSLPNFPTLAQAQVVRRFDEEISFVGESVRSDLRAALSVLQIAPFLYGRCSRYSRLGLEDRRTVLNAMMASRSETLRAIATNLVLLVHFFYFGHASAWQAMRYDGPFAKLPPIASEQRQHYEQVTRRTP